MEVGRQELHRSQKEIEDEIASFRSAVSKRSHIVGSPTDTVCLAFLRRNNFRHAEALRMLDNFFTMRSSPEYPQSKWLDSPNLTDDVMESYLVNGVHVPLGYLDNGCYAMLVRPGYWDFKLAPMEAFLCLTMRQIEMMMDYPNVQANGAILIFDMDKITLEQAFRMNPPVSDRLFMQFLQEGCPIQIKGMIYLNEPALGEYLLRSVLYFVKPELRQKVIRVRDGMDKVFEKFPGLKKLLPSDYGGSRDMIDKVIDEQLENVSDEHLKANEWSKVTVEESRRTSEYKHLIPTYPALPETSVHPFVQLPQIS